MARCSLFNGDGGREAFNGFNIRFVHLADELPGVGGQGFHIASLTFSIDGVKCKGRLAGSADPGDDNQFISRNINSDIF